jgi:hypothetical protein
MNIVFVFENSAIAAQFRQSLCEQVNNQYPGIIGVKKPWFDSGRNAFVFLPQQPSMLLTFVSDAAQAANISQTQSETFCIVQVGNQFSLELQQRLQMMSEQHTARLAGRFYFQLPQTDDELQTLFATITVITKLQVSRAKAASADAQGRQVRAEIVSGNLSILKTHPDWFDEQNERAADLELESIFAKDEMIKLEAELAKLVKKKPEVVKTPVKCQQAISRFSPIFWGGESQEFSATLKKEPKLIKVGSNGENIDPQAEAPAVTFSHGI